MHAAADPLQCLAVSTATQLTQSATRTAQHRENQSISMIIDLEVSNSVDHIITTIASDSECVSVSVNSSTERGNLRMSVRIDLGLELL